MKNRLGEVAEIVVKLVSIAALGIACFLWWQRPFPAGIGIEMKLVVTGILGGIGVGLVCSILFDKGGLAASATAAVVSGATMWATHAYRVFKGGSFNLVNGKLKPVSQEGLASSREVGYVAPLIAVCLLAGGLVGYVVFHRLIHGRFRDRLKPIAGIVCAISLASYVLTKVSVYGLATHSQLLVMCLAPLASGLFAGLSCGALMKRRSYAFSIAVAALTCVVVIVGTRVLIGHSAVDEAIPRYILGVAYPVVAVVSASVGAIVGRLVWQVSVLSR